MKRSWVLGGLVLGLIGAGTAARADTVFVSELSGANERPDPVETPATGSASATLTGDVDSYVLTYTINYSGLTSETVGGHIHQSQNPPGADPTEQVGGVVHPLDNVPTGTEGDFSGDWRFDDAENPLTNELAAALLAGELYINIHSANFPGGEIRGQLVVEGGGPPPVIPLPAPLALGLVGLGTAGLAAWKRGRITR